MMVSLIFNSTRRSYNIDLFIDLPHDFYKLVIFTKQFYSYLKFFF